MGRLHPLAVAVAFVACAQTASRETAPPSNDAEAEASAASDHPLGLAIGATWRFRGTWTRFDADQNRDVSTPVTWTTRVLSQETVNGHVVWRIQGWPGDAPGGADQESRLVIAGPTVRLDDAGAWLTLPLRDGDETCDADLGYCWTVEASGTGFDVVLRTRPDVTLYHLEPRRGITRFEYHHNGTTDDLVLDRID